ncbi:DUF2079 domain-containing protein [Nonomuraea terrae]|uniref:DUF2079 domain-containing protein n=1 Tax=Nonomuraea terrae TaxID=2530383 RepID=UPI0037AD56B5
MTGETPAVRPGGRAAPSLRRIKLTGHRAGVGAITLLAAVACSALGLVRLATFRATTFDLVIVDQAVRNYAAFRPPYVPVVGAFHGRGTDYLQLADHFSPVYALLAPLYWIHDGPATLILAQAALFAAAIPFLWRFTRRVLGVTPAYLVGLAYALSWPIAQAAAFDAHEVMFVPLLTAIMIERYHAGRATPALLAAIGLLLVKEDMGLIVIGFGLCLVVIGDRQRGLLVMTLGLGTVLLVRGGLILYFGGDTKDFWAYEHLGPDAPSALLALVSDPIGAVQLLLGAEAKIDTLFLLVWPTLLLCLLSPLSLAAAPHVLVRMLADREQWWQADFQYSAFTVVILFCAGVDGLARLLRRTRRSGDASLTLAWAVAVCVVALTLVPRFAFDRLHHADFYRESKATAAAEAAAAVPPGVTVEAANSIGPALTSKATVLLWSGAPHGSPWVVADVARWEFPFGSLDEQAAEVVELLAGGYVKKFERDGYVVLHRE